MTVWKPEATGLSLPSSPLAIWAAEPSQTPRSRVGLPPISLASGTLQSSTVAPAFSEGLIAL
jgi:hypothetical protein